MPVPPEYNIITKDEKEIAARFLRILIWARDAAQQGKLPKRHVPHFSDWTTGEGVSAKWRGWDFTLYDTRGDLACFESDLSPSLAFQGIESVEVRGGRLTNLNSLVGAGALGRVLYLISQRTWEPLPHSQAMYHRIERLLEEEGIKVGARPAPRPPSPEPSTKKRPGRGALPGINFPRVKAHVESTRYKEPAPKTEPKTEKEPTLVWGDYSALIEAIGRADPKRKRKRKKPTPPPTPKKVREPKPKPKKVQEPKPKRRIPWDLVLMLAELLLVGAVLYLVCTLGPGSPWVIIPGWVLVFVALLGLAESTKPDDQDE
jgi:hypothetical protein|nr:MAG TPA: cell division protein [Caudoviricetes sp.]